MMESHRDSEYTYRTVGMVGSSSFCLVLPKDYAINLGVAKGDPVRVRLEEGRIVIEKAKKGKKKCIQVLLVTLILKKLLFSLLTWLTLRIIMGINKAL